MSEIRVYYTNNQFGDMTMTQNSRDALRRKDKDFAYPSETDRYNAKNELKSVKRPHEVQKGELEPRAADRRGLTSDDDG